MWPRKYDQVWRQLKYIQVRRQLKYDRIKDALILKEKRKMCEFSYLTSLNFRLKSEGRYVIDKHYFSSHLFSCSYFHTPSWNFDCWYNTNWYFEGCYALDQNYFSFHLFSCSASFSAGLRITLCLFGRINFTVLCTIYCWRINYTIMLLHIWHLNI